MSLWFSTQLIAASLQLLALSHTIPTCLGLVLRLLDVIKLFYIISEISTLFLVWQSCLLCHLRFVVAVSGTRGHFMVTFSVGSP